MRLNHSGALLLAAFLAPALVLGQGVQVGPKSAIDRGPRPAIGSGRSTVVLRLPLDVPGCYASGAALGTRGEQLTMARATTAVYADANAALHACAANQLRIQGFPAVGALVEPAATNLLTYSQVFDNAAWAKANSTATLPVVTADQATAPDGTSTADQVAFGATDGAGQFSITYQGKPGTASGQTYTFSTWAKAVSGSGTLYLTLEEGSSAATAAPCAVTSTAWGRCTVTRTLTTTPTSLYSALGPDARAFTGQPSTQSALSVYVWGAQLESLVTSYIPTVTTPVSRSADQPAYSADIPAANGGAWCRGGTWTPVTTWSQIGTLWSAGSGANSASLGASGSNLVFTVTDASSGTKTVTYSLASLAAGPRRIFACTRGGTLGLFVDGVGRGTPAGSSKGVIATAPTLSLGTNAAAALLDWRSCETGVYGRGACR